MFGKQTNSDSEMPPLQQALLSKKLQPRRFDDAMSSVMVPMKDKSMTAEECPKDKPVLTDRDSVNDAIDVGRMPEQEFQARKAEVGNGNTKGALPLSEFQNGADSHECEHKKMPKEPVTEGDSDGCESETKVSGAVGKNDDDKQIRTADGEAEGNDGKKNVTDVVAGPTAEAQDSGSSMNSVLPQDNVDASDAENGVEDVPGVFSKTAQVVTLPIKPHRLTPNITLGRDPRYVDYPLSKGIELDYGEVTAPGGEWTFKKVEVDGEEKIRFMPSKEGEYDIPVMYNGGKRAVFQLTVNPDPWSLWTIEEIDNKIKEFPSDQERLSTNHKDVIGEEFAGLKVVGASRRGRSHERSGTFRDDDMGMWADPEHGNYVFIVSDGAGSCKYSREGARKAIEFIKNKLEERKSNVESVWQKSLEDFKPDCAIGVNLAYIARLAKGHLDEFVAKNKEEHPTWKVKDFSGTLLVAALKREDNGALRLITLSIGDGAIAWYLGEGKHGLMCCPDSGEFGGGTRFLTTPEVWREVDGKQDYKSFCEQRVFCKTFTPEEAKNFQLYLMSDGVSDPWFETDARLEDGKVWQEFVENILMKEGDNKAGLALSDTPKASAEKMWDWLYFKKVGNHDDRTLLMVYSCDIEKKEVCNG